MQNEINNHIELLRQRLGEVPELQPAFALAEADPDRAVDVYLGYLSLVEHMSKLDDEELARITRSQGRLRGELGSASKVGANDIVNALGEDRNILNVCAAQSLDPQSPHYASAVDTLVARMEGGHQLKLSGKSPSDHDPESMKVIWGHTIITGREALLHFMLMHYLERYMAEALVDRGLEPARQKDFFINAMTDVVILEGQADSDDPTFRLWLASKDQGGLGWITEDRLKSYVTIEQ
jgi:hypothetical protein